ncbi:polysaccharide deacetylase family protein [Luteimonas vadosa]|uniref:Polysaccharide deacetylase family protein n=1 Tax=Luteimonas vadosa TaxID=1165507 RepID=A0ABP9DTA4_9GAMM
MSSPATPLHRVPPHPRRIWIGFVLSQMIVAALWWWLGWRAGLPAMVLSHLSLFWGALWPQSRLYGPALSRLPVADKRVWLTIDDGPSGDTAAILDLLDAHGAKATFFLVGERAAARPDLVRAIAARGHGIGNHSQAHPSRWFWALGPRRMREEIAGGQAILRGITGQPPRWFRAVVGMANPFTVAPLREHGLSRVAWSARGFDAVAPDPATVVSRIERTLAPGAIVLMHEGAGHGRSVDAMALLLRRFDALGYGTLLPEALEGDPRSRARPVAAGAHAP